MLLLNHRASLSCYLQPQPIDETSPFESQSDIMTTRNVYSAKRARILYDEKENNVRSEFYSLEPGIYSLPIHWYLCPERR